MKLRSMMGVALLGFVWAACGGDDNAPGGSPAGNDGGTGSDATGGGGPDGGGTTNDGSTDTDGGTGKDGGGVTGVDVSGDVKDFDDKLAAAMCQRLTSCCSDDNAHAALAAFTATPYTDNCQQPPCAPPVPLDSTCASVLSQRLQKLHGVWAASVKRGTMSFDKSRATSCVAGVKAAACGVPLTSAVFDERCLGVRHNEVFAKIAKIGEACQALPDTTFYGECDPSLGYCDFKETKKCVAWKKTGEECSISPKLQFCGPELNCDGASPTKPGHCSDAPKTVKLGEVCDSLDGPTLLCPAKSYCDFGQSPGTCKATKADGESCSGDEECSTAHAYSCYPLGNGTCGSTAFCSGRPAGDGGSDAASDAGTDGASDGAAPDGAILPLFNIQRADGAQGGAGASVSVGQRGRVVLTWNVPNASTVSIDGAGAYLAVATDGVPTWDDLSSVAGTAPTASGNTYRFNGVIAAQMPAPTTIFGDTWNKFAINPHGVISRGAPSALRVLDTTLPLPSRSALPPDWADGTVAPFLDNHLDARDANSRIKTSSLGSGNDTRLVVEWNDMTTAIDYAPNAPLHLTFQVAMYSDGRVEYRYRRLEVDGAVTTTPILDAALAAGQSASIGIASSGGDAVPLSVHRASLTAPVTYTFYPSSALPASGRALVVTPKAAGTATYTLHAEGIADSTVTADVGPMYTASSTVDATAPRDISTDPAAVNLQYGSGTTAAIPLPFTVDVFGEGWRSLLVSRTTAIGAWGISTTNLGSGLGGKALPSSTGPTGFLAPYYGSGFSAPAWCSTQTPFGITYLVEGSAPSRKVTVQMKGVEKCGTAPGAVDIQVVVHENGDVEYIYANLTSADANLTGAGVLAGIENGNGDVAIQTFRDQAASISSNLHVTYTRHL